MSRMTYGEWKAYANLRSLFGKQTAEDYRHIRNAQHRKRGTGNYPRQSDWVTVNWEVDGDGCIQKRFLPYHLTEEQKQIFADDNWLYVYSMYDCTGQRFTRDISFHEIPTGTWVYHFIGIDI